MNYFILILLSFTVAFRLDAEEAKSIAIVTYKVYGATPWDPDSIHSGITGSEEAVIYMSQKLANLGHKVVVYGNPPENSPHSAPTANPRYVDFFKDDKAPVDVAVSWRNPSNAQALKMRAKQVYLWPHDTSHVKLSDEMIDAFDDVLWLSEWQREQWISVNQRFSQFTNIFGNGVNPEQFLPVKQKANPYSCIYASNYARGLEIMLDIWPTVKRIFPQATLDIYYGWQSWGLLSKEKEAYMRAQVDVYEILDVREHGLVSHEELNRAFNKISLWTYPCIAPETFCITAIRAQMSGCIPVILKGTALTETVRHGYSCSTANQYLPTLLNAMNQVRTKKLEERIAMQQFVLDAYTWEKLAIRWSELFQTNSLTQNAQIP